MSAIYGLSMASIKKNERACAQQKNYAIVAVFAEKQVGISPEQPISCMQLKLKNLKNSKRLRKFESFKKMKKIKIFFIQHKKPC
jgi:hypothetical protein